MMKNHNPDDPAAHEAWLSSLWLGMKNVYRNAYEELQRDGAPAEQCRRAGILAVKQKEKENR
jgi:hypothetical protein